ncbi:hypothetical protein B0G57_103151 [Trinickia symbiotica]|uniref:hypothetical protein n=1 Tax=Trinickia symbiotica TaxID=863227 RepID=UPI000D43B3DE|nr:hypothetical protein [Trinickia symbiotica]PPK46127.1 hypothetical protein B0G57_103151 [Trinickia symbiotica]
MKSMFVIGGALIVAAAPILASAKPPANPTAGEPFESQVQPNSAEQSDSNHDSMGNSAKVTSGYGGVAETGQHASVKPLTPSTHALYRHH